MISLIMLVYTCTSLHITVSKYIKYRDIITIKSALLQPSNFFLHYSEKLNIFYHWYTKLKNQRLSSIFQTHVENRARACQIIYFTGTQYLEVQ